MEDKCPKCGETLITRTIKKKIGLGSIDYPIAQTCPKCNWNKDLTGAGDIDAKPVMQDAGEAKKEEKKAQNKIPDKTINWLYLFKTSRFSNKYQFADPDCSGNTRCRLLLHGYFSWIRLKKNRP